MPTTIIFILITSVLTMFPSIALALSLDSEPRELNLFPHGHIYENSAETKSIAEILSLEEQLWKATEKKDLTVSFSDSEYWFSVKLQGHNLIENDLLMTFEMPLQDFIDIWFLDENNNILSSYQSGDRMAFETRPIKSRFFVFPLPKQSASTLRVIARFNTHDGMFETGPILLTTEEDFYSETNFNNLVYGFFYGGMFLLGVYNLLLFISHKDKRFLLYFLFITSYFLYNFSLRGFASQYFFPDSPILGNQFKPILLSFSYFTLFLFATNMLATRNVYPRSYLVFKIIVLSLLIPFLLALGGSYAMYYKIASPLAILILLNVIYIAARGSINGDRTSKIFLAAWTVLALAGILYTLRILNLIEMNLFIFYAVDFGSTIESLLLAFALGDKLNQMQLEKEHSDAMLIASQKTYNEELERKVDQRTRDIAKANNELQSANESLEILSITDPMTGLLNRRNFEFLLNHEIKVRSRSNQLLIFILLDLDHFKKLNDNLGHEKGDDALLQFAGLLKSHWARDTDSLFRLGGEEFGIIPSLQSIEDFTTQLDKFYEKLEHADIPHPESVTNSLTVSSGVYCIKSQSNTTVQQIYQISDAALYEAKTAGRNRYILKTVQ